MNEELDWPDIARRYKRLYTPAVCDVLDSYELRHQFVDHGIRPLDPMMVVAGPAFTILGRSSATRDFGKRVGPKVIDSFLPHVVAVYDTMGETQTGVWGELWSAGAGVRGCVGAVVDGAIRDTGYIRRVGFPIFRRWHVPADAVGRFNIVDFQCGVSIGGVRVNPGDYIFGDEDGVMIVPKPLIMEVLVKAEAIAETENRIREELQKDIPLAELYTKFGRF